MDEHKEPIRVYECPYCHKQFKRRGECESHIKECATGLRRVFVEQFRAIIKWDEDKQLYMFDHYELSLAGLLDKDADVFNADRVSLTPTSSVKLNTIIVTHYFTGELQVSFHRLKDDKTYTIEKIEAMLEDALKDELKKMLGDLK